MKVLIDACVLYPTVMREVVLGAAEEGLFTPLWSPRILEEWARAARKIGPEGETIARGEVALISARFPKASVAVAPEAERKFWLPDENDRHVLAAAVAGHADAILTINIKDFPRDVLAEEGLERLTPDLFLYDLWLAHPTRMQAVGNRVLAEAQRLSGADWTIRALLKKARLPRLAKALAS